ncbi:MAG: NAD-dependent deacetylase [Acidimicrobiales bacterium]|nr:NAD-dependent deacetylase [Acidimicrobiales bacterium]
MSEPHALDLVDQVRAWVDAAERIVVLTGAGISTDSGIPDFRGPNGLWTKDPKAERTSHIHFYASDPEVRRLSWQQRLHHPAWSAAPNAGHLAVVELERRGKLLAVLTQNIDGLHQLAGTDPGLVVEVHGTMREVTCLDCGERADMQRALDRVRAGEDDPPCRTCGGILKSATVSFGQALDPDDLDRAERAARAADLLLAVGTTLTVYPIAGVPPLAHAGGARVVTVNGAPTAYDHAADAVLRGPIGDLLPAICGGPTPATPPPTGE